MSIEIAFPDRGNEGPPITEADQLNFAYGLDTLRRIVDYLEESDDEEAISPSQAGSDPEILEMINASLSMRLAHGLYVRPGLYAGAEGAIALETRKGTIFEPIDDDCRVEGEIKGCRAELLPDIEEALAHIIDDDTPTLPTLLVSLKDAALYRIDERGVSHFQSSFRGNVSIPICDRKIAHAFLLRKDPLSASRRVDLREPQDNYTMRAGDRYQGLFGKQTIALLEAEEPGCMAGIIGSTSSSQSN